MCVREREERNRGERESVCVRERERRERVKGRKSKRREERGRRPTDYTLFLLKLL